MQTHTYHIDHTPHIYLHTHTRIHNCIALIDPNAFIVKKACETN